MKLQKDRLRENRTKLYHYYMAHPCVECGENRVPCLQLDHIHRSEKDFQVSSKMGCTWDNLMIEINKCQVLCANCHMINTAEQMNWYQDIA